MIFEIREEGRVVANVPARAGDYASERVTFGVCGSGDRRRSFYGFSGLLEAGGPAGAVMELWVPRVASSDKVASALTDADYTFSGLTTVTGVGFQSWIVNGGWQGAQLRVKSGGSAGVVGLSGTAL